jgi:hypothetical protein
MSLGLERGCAPERGYFAAWVISIVPKDNGGV